MAEGAEPGGRGAGDAGVSGLWQSGGRKGTYCLRATPSEGARADKYKEEKRATSARKSTRSKNKSLEVKKQRNMRGGPKIKLRPKPWLSPGELGWQEGRRPRPYSLTAACTGLPPAAPTGGASPQLRGTRTQTRHGRRMQTKQPVCPCVRGC